MIHYLLQFVRFLGFLVHVRPSPGIVRYDMYPFSCDRVAHLIPLQLGSGKQSQPLCNDNKPHKKKLPPSINFVVLRTLYQKLKRLPYIRQPYIYYVECLGSNVTPRVNLCESGRSPSIYCYIAVC